MNTALRDRGVPQQMALVPRSLVAGIDTWHLNWLEVAEVRQESGSIVTWYEAQYLHELELYTKLHHELPTYSG